MSDNNILLEISGFLRNANSIFFTFAQDMMEPKFSDKIPTACVTFLPNEGKCIGFFVNEDFWNRLNYNEKVFIFIHETLHVLFSHGKRGHDFLKTLPKKHRSDKLLNICMDICINEIIMDQYLDDIPLKTMPVINDGCFIHTVFENDVDDIERGKSFEYYYNKFVELYGDKAVEFINLTTDVHTFMDCDLETLEKIEKQIEDAIYGDPDADDLKEDKIQKSTGGYSIGSFTENGNNKQSALTKQPDSLETHLKLMISTSFEKGRPKYKNQWYGVNRRTHKTLDKTGMFLPIRKQVKKGRKHKILVYSDVSGSCESVSKRFLSLVGDLNEDVYEVESYVFADRVGKCTIKNNKVNIPYVGFGTDIRNVLSHYNSIIKNNYDAVLVLTDGYYSYITNVNDNIYDKWHFFIIDNGPRNHPKNSKCYKI